MPTQNVEDLVQGIYDGIFKSVTQAEPGGKPVANASSTYLTMMKPGLAINAQDYANPWTPGNSAGNIQSAINLAQLVDQIPLTNSLYTDSGKTVSKVYGDILGSVSMTAQKPDPKIDKQLQTAYDFLFRKVSVTDPDTGQVTEKTVETQVYRDYLDNQMRYQNARLAYVSAFLAAQETPQGKATWPMLSATFQIPVKQAWDLWRASKADLVEQNLAIMTTSSQNGLQKAFKKGQDIFEGYGANLEETGSGMSTPIHRVNLIPSDWASSDPNSGWTKVKVKSGNLSLTQNSDFKSYGAAASFKKGIVSISGGVSGSSSTQSMNLEASDLSFEYSYKLVTIRRPWLSFHLLGLKGWNLGNFCKPAGGISTGAKTQTGTMMPLLPTSFVLVSAVKITASWTKTDRETIQKAMSAHANVGIGPFKISGNYHHSKSKSTFNSAFAGSSIEVPGVQIIGWINNVLPYCAPEKSPS